EPANPQSGTARMRPRSAPERGRSLHDQRRQRLELRAGVLRVLEWRPDADHERQPALPNADEDRLGGARGRRQAQRGLVGTGDRYRRVVARIELGEPLRESGLRIRGGGLETQIELDATGRARLAAIDAVVGRWRLIVL